MQRQNNFLPKTNSNSKAKSKSVKFVSNNQFQVLAELDSDESTPKAVESSIPSIETSTSAVEYQIDLELGENSPRSASTSEFNLNNGSNCNSRGNHILDYSDDFPQSAVLPSRQQSVKFAEDYFDFKQDGSISNFASTPSFFDSEEEVISFLRGGNSSSGSSFAFPSSCQESVNFTDDFNGMSCLASAFPPSRQYTNKQFEYFEQLEKDRLSRSTSDFDFEAQIFNLLVDSAGESSPRIEDDILIADPPRCATIPPSFKETDNSKTRRAIECLLEDFASLYTFDSFQTPLSLRVRLPIESQLEGCTGRDDFSINLALRNPKTISTIHDWLYANYPNTMRENTLKISVLETRVDFSLRPKPPVVPARNVEGSFVHAIVNGASAPAPKPVEITAKVSGGSGKVGGGSGKAKVSDLKASNANTSEAKAPAKKERVTPARHESWLESAKIIELLDAATETEDGKTASITCFIKGNFEDFQTWCYHETGKKSIQIGTGKEDSIRVRIFKGDRKDFTGGGSHKDSKR